MLLRVLIVLASYESLSQLIEVRAKSQAKTAIASAEISAVAAAEISAVATAEIYAVATAEISAGATAESSVVVLAGLGWLGWAGWAELALDTENI